MSQDFSSVDVLPLLDDARQRLQSGPAALCAVSSVVLMGCVPLRLSSHGLCLIFQLDGNPACLDEHLNITSDIPDVLGSALHFYDAVSQGLVPAALSARYVQNMDLLHPQGVGMRLRSAHVVDKEKFVKILWDYNCHEKISAPICDDLNRHGVRTTTVQFHLLDRWDALKADLKPLGVSVERVLPRLNGSTAAPRQLAAQVAQLQRQWEPSSTQKQRRMR